MRSLTLLMIISWLQKSLQLTTINTHVHIHGICGHFERHVTECFKKKIWQQSHFCSNNETNTAETNTKARVRNILKGWSTYTRVGFPEHTDVTFSRTDTCWLHQLNCASPVQSACQGSVQMKWTCTQTGQHCCSSYISHFFLCDIWQKLHGLVTAGWYAASSYRCDVANTALPTVR